MRTVFIYALKDPDTGQIRYVGMSKNPQRRLNKHLTRCYEYQHHCACWIRNLRLGNMKPVLIILDEVLESEWQQWEIAYIAFFQECGCDLTNGTLGGEGTLNVTESIRQKLSAARSGEKNHWFGTGGPNKGKKASAEARARMSNAQTGRKHSAETLAKMRTAQIGRKHSAEARARMSAAQKLRQEKKRQAEILAEMWD